MYILLKKYFDKINWFKRIKFREKMESFPFFSLEDWDTFLFKENLMFYTYIIQSLVDDSFYLGYTANLEFRLEKHNEGNSRYTRKKMPWKMVYSESFE